MKSLNDIFATVRQHLLAQRAISEDDNGSCRLRGRDGGRCAIGILIHDEHYSECLEGVGIAYYATGQDGPLLRALLSSGVNAYGPAIGALLRDLEDLHDGGEISDWESQLDELAWNHLSACSATTEKVAA